MRIVADTLAHTVVNDIRDVSMRNYRAPAVYLDRGKFRVWGQRLIVSSNHTRIWSFKANA